MSETRFYKETNFQHTEIGELPQEWQVRELCDIVMKDRNAIKRGPWGGSIKKEIFVKSGYKVYEQKNVIHNDFSIGTYFITEGKFDELKDFAIKEGDILLTAAGTIGKTTIVPTNFQPGIINQALIKISLDQNIMLRSYFKFLFDHVDFQIKILSSSHGATMKNFSSVSVLKSINLPTPSVAEQEKIISVISTIDQTIKRTDGIIAETQELKKGLMQRLLTRGIGHSEFKKTEIGEMPEEWEVVRLRDVAKIRSGKSRLRGNIKNVAFVPMELIPEEGITANFVMKEVGEVSSCTYCEVDDILLAKITPSLENGKQALVPNTVPEGFALATTEVFPLVCEGIDTMFLFYLLRFPRFRKILENSMRASTQRLRVPKDALLNLMIPRPRFSDEQKRIVSILLGADEEIENEKRTKEYLVKTKKWFMDNLLTGKIRIRMN